MSYGPLLGPFFCILNLEQVDSHNQNSGSRLIAGLYCGLYLIGFGCTCVGTIGTGILFISASLSLSGFSVCLFPTSILLGYTSWLLLRGCMHFGAEFIFGPNETMTFSDGFKINQPTQDTSTLIPLPGAIQRLRDIKEEQIPKFSPTLTFWKPKVNPLDQVAKIPLPEHWIKALGKNSSLYRRVPKKLKPKLHKLINIFLCEVDFAPFWKEHPPIEITEEMRVNIAADACLLILDVKSDVFECFEYYRKMKRVIISRGILTKDYAVGLGGCEEVSLMWHSTTTGMKTSIDNGSVIIHEFAHALDNVPDYEFGGIPFNKNSPQYKPWKSWIEKLYDNDEIIEILGRNILIREEDGSRKPTEFFAAASEVYFDQPKELHKSESEIYRQLNSFYKLNTSYWDEEEEEEIPPVIIDPVPGTVPGILEEEMALYRVLPPEQKRKLIELVGEFIRKYPFEGRDGLKVIEPMKIIFAGQACILKLGKEWPIFLGFKRVILHPDEFSMDGILRDNYLDAVEEEIHFSWKAISDNINLSRSTSQPILSALTNRLSRGQDWQAVKSPFEEALRAYHNRLSSNILLNWELPMGSMSLSDFFREYTIHFFCRPECMKKDLPGLYEIFTGHYWSWPHYWVELRRMELGAKTFPEEWRQCLIRNVKHYSRLPAELQVKLHELIHIFLDEINLEVKGFQRLTDKMRLCVAAEACLLILNRGFQDYRHVECVEIWKSKPEGTDNWDGDAIAKRVRLNWHWAKVGMEDESDNYNITLHEFAHILDNADDRVAQSVPVPVLSPDRKTWEEMVDREYTRLEEAHKSGKGHVIKEYGLHTYGEEKRRAEFFPCATEAFFEQSTRLKTECPWIYAMLKTFYQLDPISWDQQDEQVEVQKPFPDHWPDILLKQSSLYRALPLNLKPKLHELINLFLDRIEFAPFEGEEPPIEITEEMRVLVAAEACILILNLRDDPLECVNLYSVVKKVQIARDELEDNVGGWWDYHDATVVLGWDGTLEGSRTTKDKYNVITHEFAHALDSAADKSCDGNPFELKEQHRRGKVVEIQLPDGQTFKAKNIETASQWQEVIEKMHEDLEKVYEEGRENIIRKYGSTNLQEFFAVATVVYFDMPEKLHKGAPDVYRLMNCFYELNPHTWIYFPDPQA